VNRLDGLAIRKLLGNTPFYMFRPDTKGASIFIKLEGNNIGGSIKDRAAWGMLRHASAKGSINKDTIIVEPTSGNTGIALAMLGSALGNRVILTMPESMSVERRQILASYGAELVLTPADQGMKGSIEKAQELTEEIKNSYMPDQFNNPGNPWAHSVTTAPEIITQLNGIAPSVFMAGIGTGGTISGTGRVFKKVFPSMKVIGLEPAGSPVISGGKAGSHKIQGIGAGFIPGNLDMDLLDSTLTVTDEEAFDTTRWLARQHGLFCGLSTGANVNGAMKIAESLGPDDLVVTIACDRGDKYLSSGVFQ
jgi:cysteine synthase A